MHTSARDGLSGAPSSFEESERRAGGRSRIPRMKRYVAFLRGVSPMNAKMPELGSAFEAAGSRT